MHSFVTGIIPLQTAVTHTSASRKGEVNFMWTAPDNDVGEIHFM